MQVIGRLQKFDDEAIKKADLNMMIQHSWYLSHELAILVLFSTQLTDDEKTQLVKNITPDRGLHLLTEFPGSISDLHISQI